MFCGRKRTELSHKTNIAPPGCNDLKPIVAFQAFCVAWQPLPPVPGLRGTPFSPGQVGILIGAVVANQSPSGSDQPLVYWKPEHQPRISPMPMTFDVPSVISAKRAAHVLRPQGPLMRSGNGQSDRVLPGPAPLQVSPL